MEQQEELWQQAGTEFIQKKVKPRAAEGPGDLKGGSAARVGFKGLSSSKPPSLCPESFTSSKEDVWIPRTLLLYS